MKEKTNYKIMFWTGFILWIAESWYFGWNETAQSSPERYLDIISLIFMGYGFFGDVFTINVNIKMIEK